MSRNGMNHGFGYIDILSEENILKAHHAIIDVLSKTGIVVKDSQMQKSLAEYGCKLDYEMDRAYFSEEIISRALSDCPGGFSISARDQNNNIKFSPGKTTYFMNGCGNKIIDIDTWEIREPTRKEFYDYIRILDALPNIDIQNCFPFFGFAKVPDCMKLLESVAAKYRVSSKVQIEGTVFDNYIFTTEMAKAMEVDLCQIVNSAAPLTYYEETSEQIRNYSNANLPFHFAAGPLRGLTSPMSSLGSVIVNNAEAMAGIVMAQAVCPGSRVWVNSMILTPDMASGRAAFGDIGNSKTDMIFNQYWRSQNIPCWSNAASWTSSKIIDYQAGFEMSLALLSQALSGATAISFQGGLNAEISVSPVKAIIDDDIVGMVKRLMEAPDTSENTGFAVDLINETGPIPGSYMETDSTLENWRDECYIPTVSSRSSYDKWLSEGQKNVLDIARQKYEFLLNNHKIPFLESSKEKNLEIILQEARSYYRKKGLISDSEWKIYQEDLSSPNYPFS